MPTRLNASPPLPDSGRSRARTADVDRLGSRHSVSRCLAVALGQWYSFVSCPPRLSLIVRPLAQSLTHFCWQSLFHLVHFIPQKAFSFAQSLSLRYGCLPSVVECAPFLAQRMELACLGIFL